MTVDLHNPACWLASLAEQLPEEKVAAALTDNNPDWEYIDSEMVKLGSLTHAQLDIPEIQRRGLRLLATESKDFRLLVHLLRTLQHAGDPLLAARLLALYVECYWTVASPPMAHKIRFASQVLKRFEAGMRSFAESAAVQQHDALLAELARLAQCWQSHATHVLVQAIDDLSKMYRRTFRETLPVTGAVASGREPQLLLPSDFNVQQSANDAHPSVPAAPVPQITIDSHDDKAWRDTLLKVAAILCERQPDSPQGFRLRRHALWLTITGIPQAESDGRTPLAAVSADMVTDYQARLLSADVALWEQVEKSLLLAPYWFDGHHLSARIALQLGYTAVADAIREEVASLVSRLPGLVTLRFSDSTPFINEQTKQWLAFHSDHQVASASQSGEELLAASACFSEQGLEAALQYLDGLPEGELRDRFHRQFLGAQLMEQAGMEKLAQQQYRMLLRVGRQTMLADWEPSLLRQIEMKFTAEQEQELL